MCDNSSQASRNASPPPCGQSRLGARRSVVGALLTLSLAMVPTQGAAACVVPEGFQRLATSEAEIAYRWEPAELKVGRFFAAEVIACRPAAARDIVLDAQ